MLLMRMQSPYVSNKLGVRSFQCLLTVTWKKSHLMDQGGLSFSLWVHTFPRSWAGPRDLRSELCLLIHQLSGEDSEDLGEHGWSHKVDRAWSS